MKGIWEKGDTLRPSKRESAMAAKTLIVARKVWVSKGLSKPVSNKTGWRMSLVGWYRSFLRLEFLVRDSVEISCFVRDSWGRKWLVKEEEEEEEEKGEDRGLRDEKHSLAMDSKNKDLVELSSVLWFPHLPFFFPGVTDLPFYVGEVRLSLHVS